MVGLAFRIPNLVLDYLQSRTLVFPMLLSLLLREGIKEYSRRVAKNPWCKVVWCLMLRKFLLSFCFIVNSYKMTICLIKSGFFLCNGTNAANSMSFWLIGLFPTSFAAQALTVLDLRIYSIKQLPKSIVAQRSLLNSINNADITLNAHSTTFELHVGLPTF